MSKRIMIAHIHFIYIKHVVGTRGVGVRQADVACQVISGIDAGAVGNLPRGAGGGLTEIVAAQRPSYENRVELDISDTPDERPTRVFKDLGQPDLNIAVGDTHGGRSQV